MGTATRLGAVTMRGMKVVGFLTLVALAVTLGVPSPETEAATTLSFSKVASVSTADPGDNITYTLTVDNLGPGAPLAVWINDSLPDNVQYLGDNAETAFGAGNFTRTFDSPWIRYQFGSLAVGSSSFEIWTTVRTPAMTLVMSVTVNTTR